MTKRIHPVVSGFLALCIALAGAVGTSPVLHQWVEHGGHGPAHTHFGGNGWSGSAVQGHEHDHGPPHVHSLPAIAHPPRVAFTHDFEPFGLPRISLAKVWQVLGHIFAAPAPFHRAPSDPPERGDHQHHSLPEMLVNGLVEQPVDAPLLSIVFIALSTCEFPQETIVLVREWNAQTASRGPPSAQS